MNIMSEKDLIIFLDKRLDRLEQKLDDMNKEVEKLMKAHWIQTGMVSTVTALVTTFITIYVGK